MSRNSVVFLALLAVGPAWSIHMDLTYECDAFGVFTAANPDPVIYTSATAGQGALVCNTTLSNNGSTIVIRGCTTKDAEVLLTLSNRVTSGDGIIGGGESHTFAIVCQEISEEDEVIFSHEVDFVVSNELSATTSDPGVTVTAVTQLPVTPRFGLTTHIMNVELNTVLDQAVLGQMISWKISGPSIYDLLPVSCFAYAGTAVGELHPWNLSTHTGWCSAISIFPKFVSVNATAMWEVYSSFPAFKFFVSDHHDHVTFACSVKVCRRGSAKCNVNCGGRRRRTARAIQSSEKSLIRGKVGWPRVDTSLGSENLSTVVAHLRIAVSGACRVGLSTVVILIAIGLSYDQ